MTTIIKNSIDDVKTTADLRILCLPDDDAKDILYKVCNDCFEEGMNWKTLKEYQNTYIAYLKNNDIHKSAISEDGNMYIEDSLNIFVKKAVSNNEFIQKCSIKSVYLFNSKNEAWFITDTLTTESLLSFDQYILPILWEMDNQEIIPLLFGESEVSKLTTVEYEEKVEIGNECC